MKKNPSIEAVTLDAAGTLIRVADPVGETYARFARDVGSRLAPEALDAGFRDVFPTMPAMAFPDVDASALAGAERAWWRDLVERVVRQAGGVAEFEKYFDALFRYYASGAAWRAYPEVLGVLESLRARGMRLAVVSNFDSRLELILRDLGIEPLVDAVIHSTACGAAKPDARIFLRALHALHATPETALHVGDSLDADYHGASSAGMTAVHLCRRKGPVEEGIPTVRQLGELEAFLEQR
jgi:putative hydrolase of the HAD superfamily